MTIVFGILSGLGGQNATNTSYIFMQIILSQYLRADLLVDDGQIDF